jgi:hypothetical protein
MLTSNQNYLSHSTIGPWVRTHLMVVSASEAEPSEIVELLDRELT